MILEFVFLTFSYKNGFTHFSDIEENYEKMLNISHINEYEYLTDETLKCLAVRIYKELSILDSDSVTILKDYFQGLILDQLIEYLIINLRYKSS